MLSHTSHDAEFANTPVLALLDPFYSSAMGAVRLGRDEELATLTRRSMQIP